MSNSFAVSGLSVLTGVTFGVWIASPDAVTSTVEWSIGTSPFDTSDGSGTASPIDDTLLCSPGSPFGGFTYSVYNASFSLPNIDVGPGTYRLTLTDTANGVIGWDENDNPTSTAWTSCHNNVQQPDCDTTTDTAGSLFGLNGTNPKLSL